MASIASCLQTDATCPAVCAPPFHPCRSGDPALTQAKNSKSSEQILLLAHGSRQPAWAQPFEQVLQRIREEHPEIRVTLAFLEFMEPRLHDALDAAALHGCMQVHLIPLFLGTGGHLQRDVQAAVEAACLRHPGLQVTVAPAAGDDPGVVEALAAYALRQADA